MRPLGLAVLTLLLSSVGLSGSAFAISETRVDLGVMVPPIQRLEIVNPALVMPELTVSELIPGFIVLPRAIELRISSNTDWTLRMREDQRSDPRGHPRNEIALLGSEESFQPLAEDWVSIASGRPGQDLALELRVRIALQGTRVNSGAYETRFDYRLSGAGE